MAAAIPNGTEKMAVPIVRYNVPMMAGRMPPARIPSCGKPERKSHEMAEPPLIRMKMTVPMMGRTVTTAINVLAVKPSRWMVWRFWEKRRFMVECAFSFLFLLFLLGSGKMEEEKASL